MNRTESKFPKTLPRSSKTPLKALVGLSKPINELNKIVDEVADFLSVEDTMNTVLVTGDSGMGKTIFVDLVRQKVEKKRRKRSYVFDCSEIEPHLIRSELFGHKKGSFTGAYQDKSGLFKEAKGSVLFLDEIGNIGREIQSSLLSALERREVMPVGGSFEKDQYRTNFGLISATNKDVKNIKEFSKELYYRIALWHIEIPPLSERKIDIVPLICHILSKHGVESDIRKKHCWSLHNLFCLMEYDWNDGGYRELEQEILYLLRNGKLSDQFYRKFGQRVDTEPIIIKSMTPSDKPMTPLEMIQMNGHPKKIVYSGKLTEYWYYRHCPERTYKAVFTEGILNHLEKRRFLTYLDLPDKTNISSSSRLHERLRDVPIYISPENLLDLIKKEIEYFENLLPQYINDPRTSFDSSLFFMGLMIPYQRHKPEKYTPYCHFRLADEKTDEISGETQIKSHYEIPQNSIPGSKRKPFDSSEMKSSTNEQRILTDLLEKYGYTELNRELAKLLLKRKYMQGTSWEELKKIHGIDRRSIVKFGNPKSNS